MTHEHSKNHKHGVAPWAELPEGFSDYLDLEAVLSTPVINAAISEARTALSDDPALILDLGAGTGAGAITLASRFTKACVMGLDISPQLLERLGENTEAAGVSDRVRGRFANFEEEWSSSLGNKADLVWAALSLHHVSDPVQVLAQTFDALRPGGALVVTEMVGEQRFEPADLGIEPNDDHSSIEWADLLKHAGFTSVRYQELPLVISSQTSEGSRYLGMRLRKIREHRQSALSADGLVAIDAAIDDIEAGKSSIMFTANRGIWVATRPEQRKADEIEGGKTLGVDAVVIARIFNARTGLYEERGGVPDSTPFGRQIPTDPRGMTEMPGIWAAGNAAQPMAMVMASAANGVAVGSAFHGDLGMADLGRAVRARSMLS